MNIDVDATFSKGFVQLTPLDCFFCRPNYTANEIAKVTSIFFLITTIFQVKII